MTTVSPSHQARSAAAQTWRPHDVFRVRLGALCLLLAGVGELIGVLLRGPLASPAGSPAWFKVVSASSSLHFGWGLLLGSAMLQCFGWLALYRWQRDSAQERWAFCAMILAIGSIIAFLPVAGALGFTSQEAVAAEAAGQQGAVALIAATAEGPFARIFLLISVLTGLVAMGLWARVFWNVARLGRWVVPLYILHGVTQSITSPMFPPWGFRLERLGAIGMLLVCAALAARMFQDTASASEVPPASKSTPIP